MPLHYLFAPPTPTNTIYYVTIPSANLEIIFHALQIEYSYHTQHIDLLITTKGDMWSQNN